jgi:hypothetical protein
MSSTRKIEGWTDPAFQMNPGNMSASVTIRANALPGDAPIVAIIGGKALTEEEHEAEFQWRAKAMVNDMARAGHLGMGPEDTYVTFESIRTIAAKYNIQLP